MLTKLANSCHARTDSEIARRDPLTAKRPELAKLIAEAVGEKAGSYLVSVRIEVEVLEKAPLPQVEQLPLNFQDISAHSQPQELVA